jgi:ribonuclease R
LIEEQIIKFFKNLKKTVTFRQLYKNYFKGIQKEKLRKILKNLEKNGLIEKGSNGKYFSLNNTDKKHKKISKISGQYKIGKVDIAQAGYGFLILDDSSESDIFIPEMKLNGALNGDKVKVVLEKYRGKQEAKVVEIIERAHKNVVGRIEKHHHYAHLIPFVRRFGTDIYIPKKYAKNVETDDIVVCEIINYGSLNVNPEAKIIKKLGKMKDEGIENLIVLEKFGLNKKFPLAVIEESKKNSIEKLKNKKVREDLTKLFSVTIDGETARDFDDAISVEKLDNGFKLYVHIADVSHFVDIDSYIDKEAYKRGTSVYFPEFAIPMLPEKLSNELCSLIPRVKRLTMTAEIIYNNDGKRISYKIYPSEIRSNFRLTYNYVNDFFENKIKISNKNLKNLLKLSENLAKLIQKRRRKQGTIDFDLPEVEFIFNKEGNLVEIKPLERGISHRLIETFMIEANEVVAEFLLGNIDTGIFRVHGEPDLKKIKEFILTARAIGVDVQMPEEITPKHVQILADKIHNFKKHYLLSPKLVRTMQKAEYSVNNIGHFGLASEAYTHFTSPIRRYPDLMVHRLLKIIFHLSDYSYDYNKLDEICIHSSLKEQMSEEAEREIHTYKKLKYLEKNVDAKFTGYINRITQEGVFVFVDKLLITGFVNLENLDIKGSIYLNDEGTVLFAKRSGQKFKLGDELIVKVFKINYDKLEIDFIRVP